MSNKTLKLKCLLIKDTLLIRCIRCIAKNISIYQYHYDQWLQILPLHLKEGIMLQIMRRGFGFKNDNILTMLLHKNLQYINLAFSKVTSRMIQNISENCHSLITLILTDGECLFTTEDLLEAVPKLPKLMVFEAGNIKQIDDNIIKCIANHCKQLDLLDIHQCTNITDMSIKSLRNMTLTKLNLCLTNISDKFLDEMFGSVLNDYIVDINLSYTNVTSNGLSNLRWDKLKYVGFVNLHLEDFDFLQNSGKVKYMQWTIPF